VIVRVPPNPRVTVSYTVYLGLLQQVSALVKEAVPEDDARLDGSDKLVVVRLVLYLT
jgi:hypothetical protein